MNKVILMGRLTRDPEVRIGQSGQAVGRYTLAVNRQFRKEGEQQQADFINIVTFGNRAEFARKWFRKGMQVAVCGEIRTGSYEKDGVKHYTTDVIATDQYFAEGRSSQDSFSQPAPNPADFAPAQPQGVPQAEPAPQMDNYIADGFTPVDTITEDQDLPF